MTNGNDADALVRLNARIANQREEIKHKQFVLEQVVTRACRVCDALGIASDQPITMRLDEAAASLRARIIDGGVG
jgi:hypothetical protein